MMYQQPCLKKTGILPSLKFTNSVRELEHSNSYYFFQMLTSAACLFLPNMVTATVFKNLCFNVPLWKCDIFVKGEG
jgi:hypothetical protein